MKRILKATLALGLLTLGFAARAQAYNSTDTITVVIRPNAYYAVQIDTGNVTNLDLGTVDFSNSTQTVKPATVTIQSTFATSDLRLRGNITAASGQSWTFDDDTSVADPNKLAAWATFTTTALSSPPTQSGDYFSGATAGNDDSDVIDAGEHYVGTAGTADRLYEATGETGAKVMDSLAPQDKSHLWLYFRMPSTSSNGAAQNITIYLTALTPVP